MDPSRLPAPVVADLAVIGALGLPGALSGRLGEWDRPCGEDRERAADDVRLLAAVAARRG